MTYGHNANLFLGPMCWVGGGKSATDCCKVGRVEIIGQTLNGLRQMPWFFGCTLIGGVA